jgi:threonine/homoserine/homoserine lactone efflux protein
MHSIGIVEILALVGVVAMAYLSVKAWRKRRSAERLSPEATEQRDARSSR